MKGPVEQAVGATHTDTAGLPKRLESRKMVLEARRVRCRFRQVARDTGLPRRAAAAAAPPPLPLPLPSRTHSSSAALPARSLANLLSVLRRRLAALKDEPHTKEDLAHYQVGWGRAQQRLRGLCGSGAVRCGRCSPHAAAPCSPSNAPPIPCRRVTATRAPSPP